MTRLYHPSISSSPVALAFPFIEWIPPTIAISRPEHSLLRSAEEGPLEYIISDHQESYAYARLLLKVLDQVTGPSNPGRVAELTLEQSALDQEDALQYLQDDKTGVVTHYLITKLYDFIGLLTQQQPDSFVQILTIFYREDKLLEDWRPLLRLLYRQGDPFSQRGAALSLMYILKEGCRKESSTRITTAEETLQSLVSWLTSRLQSSHSMSLAVVTPVLVVLGTCPPARAFFDHAGGIGYLSRHLRPMRGGGAGGPSTMGRRTTSTTMMPSSPASTTRISSFNSFNSTLAISSTFSMTAPSSPNGKRRPISLGTNSSAQQLYELVFCLWTMTYDCSQNSTMKHHFARDGAVAALAEMMSSAPREKVVRLALSSLRRLVETDAKLFLPEMIACRVLKSVDLLIQQKQWSDPDMAEGEKTPESIRPLYLVATFSSCQLLTLGFTFPFSFRDGQTCKSFKRSLLVAIRT